MAGWRARGGALVRVGAGEAIEPPSSVQAETGPEGLLDEIRVGA